MTTPTLPTRRAGRGWVMPLFLVLLIAVPIFEVWLLIQVGQQIGLGWTLLILVAEAALGGWLMRREGNRAWKALNEAFGTGKMPTGELADAALILVGGVLLMLPGFATDVIGFFFLLPFTRPWARSLLAFFVSRRLQRLGVPLIQPTSSDNLIEGEIVDEPTGPAPRPSDPQVITGEIDDGRR
ncbi:MAG: FxsA family protein [Propionibacteriaceae bacterium]